MYYGWQSAVYTQPGIEAGYLNSRYSIKGGENSKSGTPMNGFYAGVSDDIELVAGLVFHVGLNYSYTTDNSREEVLHFDLKGSAADHYLNLPLRLKYNFNIIPKVLKIQAFAGPVLSMGLVSEQTLSLKGSFGDAAIDGTVKYNYYTGKVKADNLSDELRDQINSYMPDSRYKRFDVALGGGVGVELFNLLEVKAGYDWGLLNRFKGDASDNYKLNRNVFYLSVGFRF